MAMEVCPATAPGMTAGDRLRAGTGRALATAR